jgi:hypothetical protein
VHITAEHLPDPALLEGLSEAHPGAVEAAYRALRQPVCRAIESAGGSGADGGVFFRVALLHAAQLAKEGRLDALRQGPEAEDPENPAPDFRQYLIALALAHFHHWRVEQQVQNPPDNGSTPPPFPLPDAVELRQQRLKTWSRRQFFRLAKDDRYKIQELAEDAAQEPALRRIADMDSASAEGYGASLAHFRKMLAQQATLGPEPLPDWAVAALTDAHFAQLWDKTQALEEERNNATAPAPKKGPWLTRNLLPILGLLLLGYAVYQWVARPKSSEEVYQENFDAPASLVADLERLRVASPDADSAAQRPAACDDLLRLADERYQQGEFRATASLLVEMLSQEFAPCHDDAYFALAITGLKLEDPTLSLESLSNIENLGRYGEDIYWYQALAFVQLAAQNPLMQERAQKAVERVRSNTELPARRAQAEKMLQQLQE